MVEYMDTVVGRIVDKLEELGLREKTLVLYYSDNGTPRQVESKMGDRVVLGGKGLTTDAGTRVPLIANWPGTIASAVTDDLVDSTDFIPTMLEAAGAPAPEGFRPDGQSFLPRLRGESGRGREWVFCHYDPRPGIDKEQYTLLRFARDQRFKLYDDGKLFDVPNDVLEERPLAEDAGGPEAAAARQKLQPVLDQMKV
jgi:arylsulfatase A-like enzyme